MLRSFPCCLKKFEVMLLSAHSLVILKGRREVWRSTRSHRWPTLSTLLEAEAESTSWPFPTRFFCLLEKVLHLTTYGLRRRHGLWQTRFTNYAPSSSAG